MDELWLAEYSEHLSIARLRIGRGLRLPGMEHSLIFDIHCIHSMAVDTSEGIVLGGWSDACVSLKLRVDQGKLDSGERCEGCLHYELILFVLFVAARSSKPQYFSLFNNTFKPVSPKMSPFYSFYK